MENLSLSRLEIPEGLFLTEEDFYEVERNPGRKLGPFNEANLLHHDKKLYSNIEDRNYLVVDDELFLFLEKKQLYFRMKKNKKYPLVFFTL